jgi:septum site-determining protein MinD
VKNGGTNQILPVISLHSNRGGVGKTLIAINLALAYAKLGRSTCLLDLDFRAPSLSAILQLSPALWISDTINTNAGIWEALIDVSEKYHTQGRFLVGLTNPSLNSIRDIAIQGKQWDRQTLKFLLSIKKEAPKKDVEYIILDTSPGMLYSSVNAVACSDLMICVTTADPLDIEETQRVITDLYQAFDKPAYLFLNKVNPALHWLETDRNVLFEKITKQLTVEILAIIPCYCDLLNSRTKIFTTNPPVHPFSQAIYNIANKITKITKGQ